ncbi:MAG TPA: hypothetical protein VGC92_06130 [Phenylobacterium sp.]|jgi:hypothetical protein
MLVRYSLAAKALATCLMATPAWAPGLAPPAAHDHAALAQAAAIPAPAANPAG